jgi:hypothetical protein
MPLNKYAEILADVAAQATPDRAAGVAIAVERNFVGPERK